MRFKRELITALGVLVLIATINWTIEWVSEGLEEPRRWVITPLLSRYLRDTEQPIQEFYRKRAQYIPEEQRVREKLSDHLVNYVIPFTFERIQKEYLSPKSQAVYMFEPPAELDADGQVRIIAVSVLLKRPEPSKEDVVFWLLKGEELRFLTAKYAYIKSDFPELEEEPAFYFYRLSTLREAGILEEEAEKAKKFRDTFR